MRINRNILLILNIYLIVLPIFSFYRIVLFLTEKEQIFLENTSILTIIKSFIMGIRFDIVISNYILIIPILILIIEGFYKKNNPIIDKILFYWIYILFSIAFLISSADIPYFNQFFERFSIGALEWFDNFDFVFSMIFEEPKYFAISIPFIILEILFFIFLKKVFKKHIKSEKKLNPNVVFNLVTSLVFIFLIFVGIRGRIEKKSPIRIGTAYFSDNPFLNKLGLNPVFTFMRSYLDSLDETNTILTIIDGEKAEKNVRNYLNITSKKYNSPLARDIIPNNTLKNKPNIILIIMESMSAKKMNRHGNKNNLTPFLDSLSYSKNSIYFDNFYTSGKHTFNGVFSTLFSFPAVYRKHPMKQIKKHNGIASNLLQKGYNTAYFTTHDSQFDNVEGFLRANDFQHIISQSDYPSKEVKTTLGVPDDYMFRYSISKINKFHKKNKPFFITFMTSSDHGPYYIPNYFKPKSDEIKKQIVEYADWSLNKFLNLSSNQEWYNNTIFVFIADHGSVLNTTYEIPLSYFHSPFIVYSPKHIKTNKTYKGIASQIDVFPTIMGLIKQPYINNTLGIDLIKEKRKYAIINNDNKIGIIDSTYLCIMSKDNTKLYKYKNKDKTDFYNKEKDRAEEMIEYAKSNIQIYQNMILSGNINIENNN